MELEEHLKGIATQKHMDFIRCVHMPCVGSADTPPLNTSLTGGRYVAQLRDHLQIFMSFRRMGCIIGQNSSELE